MVQNMTRRKEWKYLVYFIHRSKIYKGHFLQNGKGWSWEGNKLFSASSGDGVKSNNLGCRKGNWTEILWNYSTGKSSEEWNKWNWVVLSLIHWNFFQKNLNRNKTVGLGSCNATERYFEKSSNLWFPTLLWNQGTCSVTEMTTWKYRYCREI